MQYHVVPIEDGNMVDMETDGLHTDFMSEGVDTDEGDDEVASTNNNATVLPQRIVQGAVNTGRRVPTATVSRRPATPEVQNSSQEDSCPELVGGNTEEEPSDGEWVGREDSDDDEASSQVNQPHHESEDEVDPEVEVHIRKRTYRKRKNDENDVQEEIKSFQTI